MEVNEENIKTLSNYLLQTLDPNANVRRPAEKFLESVECNKNYPILLLHLINCQNYDMTIRVAGVVMFKNYIKRNWPVEADGKDNIDAGDREAVKTVIVDAMLTAPPAIQKQLSDAIYIIGQSDFPKKWPTLMTHMVEKFATGDFHIINGILQTAHSIFKRYRYEFKSQVLWEEIKFVLDTFSKPLTDLLLATHALAQTHATDPNALRIIYSSLLLIMKIFYSLNFQDLPEFFEDNAATWMNLSHALLTTDVKCLASDSDSEAGVMEQLRSQICFNVSLYAQKYDEEFSPFLPDFVTDIWNLLVQTGPETKYDLLVSNALKFLSTVADREHYKHLFQNPTVLSSICEKVIIPNVHFRAMDEELFEDNPEEYIRRDIEGADSETRRRSACDLVKVLAHHFGTQVSSIISEYVRSMLEEYSRDPQSKWRQKDTALYLIICLTERGSTSRYGVTRTLDTVSLPDFATANILPELDKDVNTCPVIKADCIKYIIKFRSLLPKEMLLSSVPNLIRHLTANVPVVHSFAACAIEKLLIIHRDNSLIINGDILAPLAGDLLKGLFGIMNMPGSAENEYAMKAIMRSFLTLDERVLPYLADLLPVLTQKLAMVAKNPTKPQFNHFLFETLSLSIKIVCQKNQGAVVLFEEALFPNFEVILREDIQEFIPYIMQLLALMLELHADIPQPYLDLYNCLLSPSLWERTGNVTGLVRLFRSYIKKATREQFETHLKLTGVLGVFQKLISSKSNDHEGFCLLQCLLTHCPRELMEPFLKQIFVLLFQRLMSSKTTKYVCSIVVFFSFYCLRFSSDEFVEIVDSIQPQMFAMILEKLFIPYTQKVSWTSERRITALGIGKMLTQSKQLREGIYSQLWPKLLKVLTDLMELPVDETMNPDDHHANFEDTVGYDTVYNELTSVGRVKEDILKGLVDPSLYQSLAGSLTPNQSQCLNNYIMNAD